MELKLFNETFDHRVVGGSEYQWSCYGPNARYIDYESDYAHASVIFDTDNQIVYEATISCKEDNDDNLPGPYRIINSLYKEAHDTESKDRNIDTKVAWDKVNWIDIEVVEDFLNKAWSIFNNQPFDRRVEVPIDLDDGEILRLALEAHKRDITLNKMIEHVLELAIEDAKKSTKV